MKFLEDDPPLRTQARQNVTRALAFVGLTALMELALHYLFELAPFEGGYFWIVVVAGFLSFLAPHGTPGSRYWFGSRVVVTLALIGAGAYSFLAEGELRWVAGIHAILALLVFVPTIQKWVKMTAPDPD